MPSWTIEEEIVVLFYASRRVKNATIVDLLAKKCPALDPANVRNIKQVAHKSSRLRQALGGTSSASGREWNRNIVDEWLFSVMDEDDVKRLLEFDGETAAIIDENNNLNVFVGIMGFTYGQTTNQPRQQQNNDNGNPER